MVSLNFCFISWKLIDFKRSLKVVNFVVIFNRYFIFWKTRGEENCVLVKPSDAIMSHYEIYRPTKTVFQVTWREQTTYHLKCRITFFVRSLLIDNNLIKTARRSPDFLEFSTNEIIIVMGAVGSPLLDLSLPNVV